MFAKAKLGVRQHLESIAGELLAAIREANCAKAAKLSVPSVPASLQLTDSPLHQVKTLTSILRIEWLPLVHQQEELLLWNKY